ncbi:mechanosensitive ion channel, partial [candidate division GN15 bacterium]|nr:mechanosensitive ion channel [candidate division GN15 bacterium]
MLDYISAWHPGLQVLAIAGVAIVLGLILHFVVWQVVRLFLHKTKTVLDDALMRHGRKPTLLIFPLIVLHLLMPLMTNRVSESVSSLIGDAFTVLLILAVSWLIIRMGSVVEDVLLQQYRLDVDDNLRARRIHTQVKIIKRIIAFAVTVVALGLILMGFEQVRQLGTGILASAGIAGLILGLAAQRTLSNLLAGIQIAFTQPITLDDVVIVEG